MSGESDRHCALLSNWTDEEEQARRGAGRIVSWFRFLDTMRARERRSRGGDKGEKAWDRVERAYEYIKIWVNISCQVLDYSITPMKKLHPHALKIARERRSSLELYLNAGDALHSQSCPFNSSKATLIRKIVIIDEKRSFVWLYPSGSE